MKSKGIILIVLGLLMILLLCLFVKSPSAPSRQKQCELGARYLGEGKYQEAIIVFTAAIEIDPMWTEVYAKLAEAYLAFGDTDTAMDTLRQGHEVTGDERHAEKLAGLESAEVRPALDPCNGELSDNAEAYHSKGSISSLGGVGSGRAQAYPCPEGDSIQELTINGEALPHDRPARFDSPSPSADFTHFEEGWEWAYMLMEYDEYRNVSKTASYNGFGETDYTTFEWGLLALGPEGTYTMQEGVGK